MKNTKKYWNLTTKSLTALMLAGSLLFAACSGKPAATGTNSNANSTAKTTAPATPTTSPNGAASAAVRQIYDLAVKRDCAAIPPMLTDEFKKAVGTSKDELDALCDSFTDSGKITSVEVKSEDVKGEAATVKVTQNFKDGKKEDKEEKLKKSADGRWLMDS